MSERNLITGGAGFIGLHLARALVDRGGEVFLLDDFSRGVRDAALEDLLESGRVQAVSGDIRDERHLAELGSDFDHIFHLAAIVGVPHVLKQPYRVLEVNVDLLTRVLRFAQQQRHLRRFVFASTSEVYAGTLQHFGLEIPTPESSPLTLTDLHHPRTSYMLSKLYGEALCLHSGLPVTIVRPHNFYGPRMGLSHVVPELLKKAHELAAGDALPVFSVDHRRTFCYIADAVEMIIAATLSERCLGEQLNIGCEAPEILIGDLARQVLETVGRGDTQIAPRPAIPGSPLRRAPSMTKTIELTGVRPEVELKEGLRRTWEWYRSAVFERQGISAI